MNKEEIRADFPILQRKVNGKPLVYLDNAASSQKPLVVIDTISNYYKHNYSNIHRGVHTLSQEGTEMYENVRKKTASFINAVSQNEIIFTKGTTDAFNLLAHSYSRSFLKKGDKVLISTMEHHANIVPWQIAAEIYGIELVECPIHTDGTLDTNAYDKLLETGINLVSITYVSNTLGTINPIKELIAKANAKNIHFIVDAAQASPHMILDVQDLGCDFLTFSAHKMLGPTGVGILWGKSELLNQMQPYQGGGDMIDKVTIAKTTYNDIPHKFEAGTPNIADVIGFGAALDYLLELGMDNIAAEEHALLTYASTQLKTIPNLKIYNESSQKAPVISFNVGEIHPYDIGVLLDQFGIAIRTGHHCTQPLMDFYSIPGTCRASFAFYNTTSEIDYFVESLIKTIAILS